MSKLLSQGGYGCVYYPGISCNGETSNDRKYISKLQANEIWTRREISIGKRVANINNYIWFFAPIVDSCPIKLRNISDKAILNKCEVIKDFNVDYLLMYSPYIDKIGFYDFLFKEKDYSVLLNFIEMNKFLLSSIYKLIKSNILHFDLKAENIIYKSNKNTPIIIDFGISIDLKLLFNNSLTQFFYGYHPEYPIWPIEVHLINYLLHVSISNIVSYTDITNVCSDYVFSNTRFSNAFSNNFIEKYYIGAVNYYNKFIGMKKEDAIKSLIDTNWKTWDVYQLNILNLHICNFIFNKKYFKNKLLIYFFKEILTSIHYDPSKRSSIIDKIAIINSIYFQFDTFDDCKILKHQMNILAKSINI